MNKNNAGFLAVLGVAIAAAIGAFFFAPKLFKSDTETASQSAPKSNMVDATAPTPDEPSAGPAGTPSDAVEAEADASADPVVAADAWVTPSFDVLRVEPDGSTVIAGRGEPNTTLDIMNGETVIASTPVGSSGDFAAILDTPLSAGDYQLTLRIVGEDGSIRLSEEVATVSIPENADGDLLAMVSKPGKASRIIAQPTADTSEEAVEVAAATPESSDAGAAPVVTDQAASSDTGSEQASIVETDAAATVADAAPAANGEAASETKTETAAASDTPPLPAASSLLTTSAPQLADDGQAAGSSETATAPESGTDTEVAMASPDATTEVTTAEMPADASVRVDAVEIEGDKIFIAGSATPGYRVQVAADGVVIGTEKADETGRFIVEAISQLAVGDHTINADLMDEAGENVLLRATVPFNRPEGEALAAVAPAEPAVASIEPGKEASPDAPEDLILPDIASLSKMREEAFEALSSVQKMVAATDTPDAAAVSDAFEVAVAKLKSAAIADLPAGSSDEAMAIARSMRIQAEAALAVIMPKVADTASNAGDQSSASQDISMTDDLVTGDLSKLSDILTQAETVLSEPADMAVAVTDVAEGLAVSSGQPEGPKTILQAPLASTPGAVIIRRGDTLWQISRRTYGEGVRYTTIYVANRSQILDPNRIKPGQVFSVPENPLENAEELHQQLLGKGKNP